MIGCFNKDILNVKKQIKNGKRYTLTPVLKKAVTAMTK